MISSHFRLNQLQTLRLLQTAESHRLRTKQDRKFHVSLVYILKMQK